MAEKETKEFNIKRGLAKSTISRLDNFADKVTERTQRSEIVTRLEYLERAFSDFLECNTKLASLDVLSELPEYETKYFNVKDKFQQLIQKEKQVQERDQVEGMMSGLLQGRNEFLSTLSSSFTTSLNETIRATSDENHTSVRLPTLRLPKLSGKYEDFPNFKHITVSDANYTQAWEKICDRYDKGKLVLSSLIRSFIEQPAIQQPSIKKLRQLFNTSNEVNRGIIALGGDATKRDPWLIYILLSKADADTREAWAHRTVNDDYTSYDECLKFLSERCDALESCAPVKQCSSKQITHTIKTHQLNPGNSMSIECLYCKGSHCLCYCEKFKDMSPNGRRELTAKLKLCFNCLSNKHRASNCSNKFNCLKCRRRHHTLLHIESSSTKSVIVTPDTSTKSVPDQPQVNAAPSGTIITNTCSLGNTILLTAIVRVKNQAGHISFCRLLLDSGSQTSFISQSCANKLNLNTISCRLRIEGIATSNSQGLNIKVLVLPKITTLTANQEINNEISQWSNVQLADPRFYERNEVDILLGSDYFFHILKPNQIQLAENILAQETIFGYVIAGLATDNNQNNAQLVFFNNFHLTINDECSLDETLQQFWKQEGFIERVPWTSEEEACESNFKATFLKNENVRFIVQLPIKANSPPLGKSYHLALQRLIAMEKKMNRNEVFGKMYREFMEEYLNLGHMRAVQDESENSGDEICYLPHHGVICESSTTTKLRVVFDGSAPTSTGTSVNDKLLVGPTLQDTLWTILVRFRGFKVALCADIEKMYRQVLVSKILTSLQRILWRKQPDEPVGHYELLTVTYGTSSAPFLAVCVLHQIAADCKLTHPEASSTITKNFYVNDLLAGATTEQEVLQLKSDLEKVLAESGFLLRKWHSNIPSLNDSNETTQIFEEGRTAQTMGLHWNPLADQFWFKIKDTPYQACSKRNILSITSKIFDPLGWLNPFTVNMKILMQALWLRKIPRDEPLPIDLQEVWANLYSQFKILNQVRIPRCVADFSREIQLHGFSDASEMAYSAVVYVRSKGVDEHAVHLLTAKSKVAPIKQLSIPRLELCGAHLLAKLIKAVLHAIDKQHVPVWLWTDSMVVLAWLNSHRRKWKNYIANRVGAIHTLLPEATWQHIKGSEIPADLASRGITADKLITSDLWFKGPKWLSKPETNWPTKPIIIDTVQEVRSNETKICHITLNVQNAHPIALLLERRSDWPKLLRLMAYVLRFIYHYYSKQNTKSTIPMNALDLNAAEVTIIRYIQQVEFEEDIKSLTKYKQVSIKSKLKTLVSFLDSNNVLRVGGRLENSHCSYDTNPMILSKKHIITSLILRHLHKKHLHPGPSLLTAVSRQKYWILGVREMARRITRKCVTSHRYSTLKSTQQMGSLPEARVTPSRPFSKIGLDYAGPILILSKPGRGAQLVKGFIVIFVCFATKALHIEVASSLTTQAFINALDRFVGRRGVPMEIFSDNGSNFLGAKRMLHEYYSALSSKEAVNQLNEFAMAKKIIWHLIPLLSPHFGGIWDSTVKSVKTHLIKIIGTANRTFKEIQTVLIQIEGILNSRPLCAITNEDTCNIDALTPGLFLTLGPITAHPNYEECKMTRLNRWEQTQKIVQSFWHRYTLTYLNTLQQRTKWQQKGRNLQIDDVVLLHDKNAPPCTWLIGRVKELHAGADEPTRGE